MLSNGKVDCLTKKKQLAQLTFSILTFTYCNPSHLDAQYLHQLLMGNRSFILINAFVWLILIYRFLKGWGQKWELFSGAQTLSRRRHKECHSHRGAVFKTIYLLCATVAGWSHCTSCIQTLSSVKACSQKLNKPEQGVHKQSKSYKDKRHTFNCLTPDFSSAICL